MKRFAIVALILYGLLMLASGQVARERYEASTPKVLTALPLPSALAASEGADPISFPQCIPLSAIHSDEDCPYVFVVDERSGYFGHETVVRKVVIELVACDGETAALSPGALGASQDVVFESNRLLEDGEPVIVVEEAHGDMKGTEAL